MGQRFYGPRETTTHQEPDGVASGIKGEKQELLFTSTGILIALTKANSM